MDKYNVSAMGIGTSGLAVVPAPDVPSTDRREVEPVGGPPATHQQELFCTYELTSAVGTCAVEPFLDAASGSLNPPIASL